MVFCYDEWSDNLRLDSDQATPPKAAYVPLEREDKKVIRCSPQMESLFEQSIPVDRLGALNLSLLADFL